MNYKINLEENTKLFINEFSISENKLIIDKDAYEINIDIGTVIIYDINYKIILESTNITSIDIKENTMTYYFNQYLFNISNNIVRFRGDFINLDKFILNVSLGRILINNNYHSFTIENNLLLIGTITNYNHIDLYNIIQNKPSTPNRNFDDLLINRQLNQLYDNKNIDMFNLKDLYNDSQNVHNSYILNNLKKIINKLQQKTQITKTIDECLNEIKKYINKRKSINSNFIMYYWNLIFPTEDKAIKSVDYIEKNNGYISIFEMYELQVLQLIWNTIYNDENLKEILYFNLIDMQHSYIKFYCLTGRVTRLIDIFSGVIEEFNFNKGDIRKEMMNKCAKIRNDLEKNDIEDDLYTTKGTLENEIKKQLYIDYVDSKILSIDEFNNELNEWINEI